MTPEKPLTWREVSDMIDNRIEKNNVEHFRRYSDLVTLLNRNNDDVVKLQDSVASMRDEVSANRGARDYRWLIIPVLLMLAQTVIMFVKK